MVADDLDVGTIRNDLALILESVELLSGELGEAELSGDSNLLSAGELEHGSSQSLLGVLKVGEGGSDRDDDVTNVDSGGLAVRLSEGTSHTLLESISSSAGKHLVDSDNVPGVLSGSHVETFLSGSVGHVLVAGNTGSLESLRGDLLLLTGNQVNAVGEFVELGLLLADVEHSDLGIRDTTAVSGLGVGLTLLVSIATSWSSSHLLYIIINNTDTLIFA